MHHEGPGSHRPSDNSVVTRAPALAPSIPRPQAVSEERITANGAACAASCVLVAPPSPDRATKHPYSQMISTVCMLAANPLEPFALCPAFPDSDYYDSSAPPHRQQPTTRPPRPIPGRLPSTSGTGVMVPVFTVNRSTGEVPSYAPATSPWLRRRPSPRPPDRRHQPNREFPAEAGARRCPAHIRQVGAGGFVLRGVQPLVPRVHLPISLVGPDPSGSAGSSRRCRGCLPPSPASPGSGCPQLRPGHCDGQAVVVSRLGAGWLGFPGSVSPSRSPHRTCDSHRIRRSTDSLGPQRSGRCSSRPWCWDAVSAPAVTGHFHPLRNE